MITTIIWDNDGVLVDTESLYYEANRDILASVGCTLEVDTYRRLSLVEGRSMFDLLRDRYSSAEIEALRDERNRHYDRLLAQRAEPMPRVRQCLEALRATCRMGIVTGSRRDHFDTIHKRSGLLPFFEFVLTHDDYAQSKPHPEPYLLAVERFGLNPTECVVVEDSGRGVVAAAAAGLRCIAIPNDLTRGSDFSRATHVLDDISNLPALLDKLSMR